MREKEIKEHLMKGIIPFWRKLRDEIHGGYYGSVDSLLNTDRAADKGGILNSRILWFFSNGYLLTGEKELLAEADHAYEFLRDRIYDKENGGCYWSVTYEGKPSDDTKHTYNQAFAVYALSSYYDASRREEAILSAYEIVRLIESKCRDEKGYLEAFDREFRPALNEKLSENGVMAARTMNTLLHVFEAYTELYRVDPDKKRSERIGELLREIMDIFMEQVYDPGKRSLYVFFDREMNSLIDLESYGHNIEAAWLLDRGCEVLEDKDYAEKISEMTKALTERVYEEAYRESSLYNECCEGKQDKRRVWWVQAEGVVGFLNGYRKTGDVKYLEAASRIWDYIKEYVIDKRQDSEWLNELDETGKPLEGLEIAGPWKCPYHNGRMCYEVVNRGIIL